MAVPGYKLIVSDFDGTLRRSEGGISDGNIKAIEDYVAAGGVFAFCTGRMLSSILPYAKQLGLRGLVVAYQGAVIADIESGRILRDVRIPSEDAVRICEFLQSLGRHIHVYDGDDVYMNRDDEMKGYYEKVCGVSGILTGEDIASFVREKGICPQKVLAMNPAEENGGIFGKVNERFGTAFDVTCSSDFLVEVPLDKTAAIGDNYNDIPMSRKAGLGVAGENGVPDIRKAAAFVTKNCDEDGVGYVIRKFGLGENV